MRLTPVTQAWLAGKTVLGTSYGQLRDPEIARILKAAGFDYAYLDGEHGCFGIETQQDICRVAGLCGLTIFARVADMQYDLIARSLDCGADGIIFPRVESPELLAQAVSWCKFPPVGIRGFGLTTMQAGYEAVTIPEMIAHRNENGMVILQIETQRA
ncbi:MAG: HpcH/HpaI aldolase family protein, partial [Acidobacteriota bacterium]